MIEHESLKPPLDVMYPTPVQPPGYQEYDQCDLGMFRGYKIRVEWAHSQLSRWSGTFFRVHLKIVEKKCNKTEFEGLSLLMLHKIKLNHHEPEKWKMINLVDVKLWIELVSWEPKLAIGKLKLTSGEPKLISGELSLTSGESKLASWEPELTSKEP